MSARAARRLEAIGFEPVYDYAAGKADWGAAGLPREGRAADEPTAADAARDDVPTCRLEDGVDDVRARLESTDWEICMVVNEPGVVLGRVRRRNLGDVHGRPIEVVMTEGPGTVRPNARLAPLVERLQQRGLSSVIVTRSNGTLVGVIRLAEAERLLHDAAGSRRE